MFDIETCCNNNCPDFQFKNLIGLIETNSFCRADNFADLAFPFNIIGTMFPVDYRSVGNCLRKRNINGRPHSHSLFKFVWYLFLRTFCCT